MTKLDVDNYEAFVSIPTLTVISGQISDGAMHDGNIESTGAALWTEINGAQVARIIDKSPAPWAGLFKFLVHNDGRVEIFQK